MRTEQIELTVEELRVAPHSALCGKTIANSEIHKKTGALIVGVKMPNGKMMSNPPGDHILNEDQILIVLGNPEQLGQLDKALSGQVQHLAPTLE
jgi:voltage-gated potassium channel